MPLLTRMRAMAPVFIIAIGVLFILFMVLQDSRIMEIFGGHSNLIGTVNGKDITYQEFSKKVEEYRLQYKQAYKTDFDDDNIDQLRDQMWEDFISRTLTKQQIDNYNIVVTDKEVNDGIFGPNPPDFLKKQFIDSTGNFRRDVYENAIKDPRNKEIIQTVKDVLKEQLYTEKLQAAVNAAALPSAGEIKRRFIDQNLKMTADYALVDISLFPENTINVTPDEVKKYYNENPEKFSVDALRKIKYVLFPIQASHADTESVRQSLQSLADLAASDTLSLDSLAKSYSGMQVVKDSSDISVFPTEVTRKVMEAKKGQIIGPFASPSGYAVYQFSKTTESKDPVVSASHILISGTDTAAEKLANKLYAELKGGANFEEYARKYSKDPGSGAKGGDLGWFAKGRMVPEFDNAAFTGKIGEIQKPIKTQFGYHIIKVTGKNSSKFFYEKIAQVVKPSAGTKDMVYQKAADFQFIADKNGFESEATAQKYQVVESAEFSKDANYIPNIGAARSLISFSFDNSVNSISKPLKTSGGYVVAKIAEDIKPGVRKFDAVEKDAKALLIKEKRLEKAKQLAESVKSQIGDDINRAAQINSSVRVGNAQNFKTDGSVPTVGLEYNFAAKAFHAPLNKVIGPVKGTHGYFLIKVTQRDNFDENTFKVQYDILRDNIGNSRRQGIYNQWLAKLKADAKISDRRYMFF